MPRLDCGGEEEEGSEGRSGGRKGEEKGEGETLRMNRTICPGGFQRGEDKEREAGIRSELSNMPQAGLRRTQEEKGEGGRGG